jgi:hypothetical protein
MSKHLLKSLLLGSILAGNLSVAFGAEEPVATGTRGDRIDLYDSQVSCPEGLKRAVYTFLMPHPQAGETIEGCWRADNMRVFLVFADGDSGAVGRDAFAWRLDQVGTRL